MRSINQSEKNLNLIKLLNSKLKPNFKEISKKLGTSRQTFQNNFDKLKQDELIKNFTININPNILPKLNYVILEIKTNPKEPYLVEELLKISQLKMLDGILGEFSLIALFIFKSSEDFNQILSQIDFIMAKSYFRKYQLLETIKVFKTNSIKLSDKIVSPKLKFDEKYYLILEILSEKQTSKLISTYNISKLLKAEYNLDMSQATIYNRIKKLEDANVILNYSINFRPARIGFKGKFLVRIKPRDPSNYDEIALKLEKYHNITDLFRIGEQYGLFAIVRVKEIENYAIFIKNLYDSGEIEDTYTNFVLDELRPYTNFIIS